MASHGDAHHAAVPLLLVQLCEGLLGTSGQAQADQRLHLILQSMIRSLRDSSDGA